MLDGPAGRIGAAGFLRRRRCSRRCRETSTWYHGWSRSGCVLLDMYQSGVALARPVDRHHHAAVSVPLVSDQLSRLKPRRPPLDLFAGERLVDRDHHRTPHKLPLWLEGRVVSIPRVPVAWRVATGGRESIESWPLIRPSGAGPFKTAGVRTMDPLLAAAVEEAQKGLSEGGIPIGSVLVIDGEIVGQGTQPPRATGQRHPARRDGLPGERRPPATQRLPP